MHLIALAAGVDGLSTASVVCLVFAIGLALAFEFVNGFHDTANAVATVIYTHTLRPWVAVPWSGACNLAGVLASNGLVAYTILALLPPELVLNIGSGAGFAMIFALLVSAILWNLGTWYLGLPASSSHTLIGSILGVGVANAVMSGHTMAEGVNWKKVEEVFLWLAISPAVGFLAAGAVLLTLKAVVRTSALFQPPPKDAPPPWPIRAVLVLTCTGVSFFHGSNDGQKGLGLLLLILIAILPAEYALNLRATPDELRQLRTTAAHVQPMLDAEAAKAAADPAARALAAAEKPPVAGKVRSAVDKEPFAKGNPANATGPTHDNAAELAQYLQTDGKLTSKTFAALAASNRELAELVRGKDSLRDVPPADRRTLRADLYVVDQTLAKLVATKRLGDDDQALDGYHKQLDAATKYIPTWVKVAVALALGCGTMVGWKRIVTTVGEKIGKTHLTYAQGMAAELVAMTTIAVGDRRGLPISTTHVLSGGIAGTMAANGSGLQAATLRNIVIAWVLTLPVCVCLGATLFAAGLLVVLSHAAAVAAVVVAVVGLGAAGWRVARRRSAIGATGASPSAVGLAPAAPV